MRAAVHSRYGPPEVVRVQDVAKPTVKDNEVLVRVRATTVNRTDCGFRAAKPFLVRFVTGLRRPRATVWGTEFAGEVEAVGAGVRSFTVSDRVFGYIEGVFGAHAEYVAVAEDGMVATMPTNSTFEAAAASTEGSHYALALFRAAQIRSGHDVLVNGATGAIGSAAVQLLRNLGARVTAVCGPAHIELAKGLGADRVIDYTREDFTKDTQTYNVVLDAVGKSSFGQCKRLLKPKGLYLSTELGRLSQNPLLALITPLFGGKKVRFPVPKQNREIMSYLKEMIESGAFKPVIDRRYRLDQIVEAYRYVESGQKIGTVVITMETAGDPSH